MKKNFAALSRKVSKWVVAPLASVGLIFGAVATPAHADYDRANTYEGEIVASATGAVISWNSLHVNVSPDAGSNWGTSTSSTLNGALWIAACTNAATTVLDCLSFPTNSMPAQTSKFEGWMQLSTSDQTRSFAFNASGVTSSYLTDTTLNPTASFEHWNTDGIDALASRVVLPATCHTFFVFWAEDSFIFGTGREHFYAASPAIHVSLGSGTNSSCVSPVVSTPSSSTPSASSSTPAVAAAATKTYSSKPIDFSLGTSSISDAAKKNLKATVAAAGKTGKYTITGSAGQATGVSDKAVKALAKKRANILKAYLVKLGVSKSSITIKTKIVKPGKKPKVSVKALY